METPARDRHGTEDHPPPEEPGHFENEDFDHQLSALEPPGSSR